MGVDGLRKAPVLPFDLVAFGGTGDLARRKLMPALYQRDAAGRLPEDGLIWGVGRRPQSDADYAAAIQAACETHISDFTAEQWQSFGRRLRYVAADGNQPNSFASLADRLQGRADRVRVFYLAVAPELYGPICLGLAAAGLITRRSRVVLEKPIGHDLDSARRINDVVGEVFQESQIFRIDHYLGKEAVQNLMVMRFANSLFEPLWSHQHVDHVQLTVAESLGVAGRSEYYDRSGALRDMVQNHMLQLLCLVTMEPPTRLDADAVRDEKIKVLRALRPLAGRDVAKHCVRGQYVKGAVDATAVPGYLSELDAQHGSRTETFVAIKAAVDNWRWGGVPFYFRTGKRLPARYSEIVVQFREVPHVIFPEGVGAPQPNRCVIRLQPDEGIEMHLMNKVPGSMRIRNSFLNLRYAETFATRSPGAYERLLTDVVRGDATLFMRRDEVDAAWSWIQPIHRAWEAKDGAVPTYAAGTWGPSAAIALIERDGRTWHEHG